MSDPKAPPPTKPIERPPPRIKREGLGGWPANPIPPKPGPRVGPHAPTK